MHTRADPINAAQTGRLGGSWALPLFMVSMFLPWVVHIGPADLSMHRIVLLIAVVPCFFALVTGRCGRIRAADWAVLSLCLWVCSSIFLLTEIGAAIESSAIFIIETAGAYLLARCYIRSAADYRRMGMLFVTLALTLLPIALLEAFTGRNVVLDISRMVLPTIGDAFEGYRMGLRRVQGVFEHPILFGVNVGCAFPLAYYVAGDRHGQFYRLMLCILVAVTTGLSLSSAPLSGLVLQLGLIAWNGAMRAVPQRWLILCVSGLTAYAVIETFSDRSFVELYINYFSFNPYNGYYRLAIWHYGTENLMRSPWIGIGNRDWARPDWMTSSVDNFWLAMAMRFGIPAIFSLISAFVLAAVAVSFRRLDDTPYRYRIAYLSILIGFTVAGCTVHFWGSAYVLCLFMLGSGLWLADAEPEVLKAVPSATRIRGGIAVAGLRRARQA